MTVFADQFSIRSDRARGGFRRTFWEGTGPSRREKLSGRLVDPLLQELILSSKFRAVRKLNAVIESRRMNFEVGGFEVELFWR